MFNKVITIILCCYFLLGSIVLPLGDFSLLKELPQMYRNYQKIAVADEQGIFDFVGDYLMGGKDFLGHNKKDAPESSKASIKFQHQASTCITLQRCSRFPVIAVSDAAISHIAVPVPVTISGFHPQLLRPPLRT